MQRCIGVMMYAQMFFMLIFKFTNLCVLRMFISFALDIIIIILNLLLLIIITGLLYRCVRWMSIEWTESSHTGLLRVRKAVLIISYSTSLPRKIAAAAKPAAITKAIHHWQPCRRSIYSLCLLENICCCCWLLLLLLLLLLLFWSFFLFFCFPICEHAWFLHWPHKGWNSACCTK